MTSKRTVVVDGSNLATEGRSMPSLAQLDECVRAFAEETPNVEIIVVVDATFEHRIEDRERRKFKEAELAGEVVTPPAGAIGRGDAFILRIAARSNAVVLSNDSFQEFHGEHPWLFDDGRLIGGKPIPGIGWVFTPRNPVRGPKSRASRAQHVEKLAAPAAPAAKRAPRKAPADSAGAVTKAAKKAVKKQAAPEGAPAKRAAKKAVKKLAAPEAAPAKRAAKKAVKKQSAVAAAPEKPTTSTKSAGKVPAGDAATRASKREGTDPVNTPRAFNTLVKEHPLRSKVEGTVVAFTSHGATISVAVGRGVEAVCYAPLARLGRPAPTKARDVLKKGETRTFKVVAFDNERRIAEVSLS